jgi:hypothetical protein
MNARWMTVLGGLAGLVLLALVAAPGIARAQCCTPPPSCNCTPPKPPRPPADTCCGSGGHQIKVPGVNVVVGASVVVNATSQATVNASAGSSGGVVVYGGGGSSFSMGSGPVSVIQNLNVEGGARTQRTAYSATRTKVKTVVIQAFCLDDREVPHPASQVSPDRDIPDSYDGEIYRCLAGTRMQVTFADYEGRVAFDKGQTMMCAKGEALYYSRSGAAYSRSETLAGGPPGAERAGRMECRPQKAARDCNERSLLRRFGAGVKILRIVTTETYTAFREEVVQSSQMSSFSMSVDGGVGGVAY